MPVVVKLAMEWKRFTSRPVRRSALARYASSSCETSLDILAA
jgi:hypothetical protein